MAASESCTGATEGGAVRDYQRKRTKYILPPAVYHKTLWTIRDYHRIKDELQTMLSAEDNGPKEGLVQDPTYKKAIKYSGYLDIVNAVEAARKSMPPEYRDGVWNNVLYNIAYPKDAERATYGHLKSRFIFEVATLLHYV